ncbi:MAG TPA: hypothetical protein VH374_17450 [Polyangia bacterium]|jgi:hypothetical protein|nr:hypothetical protein [Polyangia bacterium]
MTRTKLGLLTVGFALAGVLIGARVAVSQKAAPSVAPTRTSPVCEKCAAMALEKAHKAVDLVVETGHWTKADHDKVGPLFHTLHTDQKIELLRKIGGLIDQKKLVVDKGARLF